MAPHPQRRKTGVTERNVARRVAYERALRGWSYDLLSKKLHEAGAHLAVSSLNRLERDDPPRRVNLDELFAFMEVFGLTLEEITAPPEEYRVGPLISALDQYVRKVRLTVKARHEALNSERHVTTISQTLTRDEIEAACRSWAMASHFPEDLALELASFLSGTTTESPLLAAHSGDLEVMPDEPIATEHREEH